MLSHFPSTPGEEPVSRDVLRAELGEVKSDLHDELRKMTVTFTCTVVGALTFGMGVAAAVGAAFGAG